MTQEEIYSNATIQSTIEVFSLETVIKYPMIKEFHDDLKQEMWLFLFQRLSSYDASRSTIETFASKILDIARCRFLRSFFADKNQEFRLAKSSVFSKGNSIQHEKFDVILEPIETKQTHFEKITQTMDIATLKKRLPPSHWNVCEKLQAGKSIRQIAREMRMERRQFYKTHIDPIRKMCCQLGLR